MRRDTGRIDLDEVRALALRERPRVIFCGGTAIPRLIDFEGFAECGAVLPTSPGSSPAARTRHRPGTPT